MDQFDQGSACPACRRMLPPFQPHAFWWGVLTAIILQLRG